ILGFIYFFYRISYAFFPLLLIELRLEWSNEFLKAVSQMARNRVEGEMLLDIEIDESGKVTLVTVKKVFLEKSMTRSEKPISIQP
ncbi:hypothetical protein, partial [Peijinzhouia sedimentorum]